MNGRVLPNNLEAEQSVLGSMFLSNYALQKACDALTEESFHYPKHAKIFSTVKEMFDKKIPIDTTTVTTELKNKGILSEIGGVEYLTEIFNIVPTSANIEHYIKNGFSTKDAIKKVSQERNLPKRDVYNEYHQ